MNKLVEVILKHKEIFTKSVERRRETSTFNKGLHFLMLVSLEKGDLQIVEELITSEEYQKPLEGVIYCMNTDPDTIQEFLNARGEK